MSRRRWFGARATTELLTSVSDQLIAEMSLDFVNMHDGDTIVRWLFGWRLETVLLDNGSSLEKAMTPFFISFAFSPSPDGEGLGSAGGPGGDQLYRDFARWRPQSWTNGSSFATKWYADSPGGMVTSQAQRTVHDKTVAAVNINIQPDHTGFDLTGSDFIFPDVKAWWWLEMLVQTNF